MIVFVRGPSGSGKSTLVERLGREHGLGPESEPFSELQDGDGETVNEKVFVKDNGEKKRIQIWRADFGLWVLGTYEGKKRRKLGSAAFDGRTSVGGGADPINGPIADEMLRYYVGLGLEHLVFESNWGSSYPAKDASPELLDFLRQSGIVFARLTTSAEEAVLNKKARRKGRGETEREDRIDKQREQERTVANTAKRLHDLKLPTVSLPWANEQSDLAYEILHDLFMWGGLACKHDRPLDYDWDAYFDYHASGWRPPVPDPDYLIPSEFDPPEPVG